MVTLFLIKQKKQFSRSGSVFKLPERIALKIFGKTTYYFAIISSEKQVHSCPFLD